MLFVKTLSDLSVFPENFPSHLAVLSGKFKSGNGSYLFSSSSQRINYNSELRGINEVKRIFGSGSDTDKDNFFLINFFVKYFRHFIFYQYHTISMIGTVSGFLSFIFPCILSQEFPRSLQFYITNTGEKCGQKALPSQLYHLQTPTLYLDSGWGSTLSLGVRKILPEVSQLPCQLMHDFFEDH